MRSTYDLQGDVRVVATVKQHGFTVAKGDLAAVLPIREASRAEEAGEGWPAPVQGSPSVAQTLLNCARSSARATPLRAAALRWALPSPAGVEVVGCAHAQPEVQRLVQGVSHGLLAHQEPVASNEGLGGTYFFSGEAGGRVGIMKPVDEEPLAPNNPKGFVGRALGDPGLKPTVRVGEAAMREVAAYLLDHEHFARVPATALVKMTHPVFHVAPGSAAPPSAAPESAMSGSLGSDVSTTGHLAMPFLPVKLGSLQKYVAHDCDTSEMGSSRFAVADVHRIGILDLRLFNTDRHAGNILVRRPRASGANLGALARLDEAQLSLVPIDHGFCLPEALEPPYLEWQHWPQAMIPFDEEELDYIARLDPEADAALLRAELPGLREGSLRVLAVASALLQIGASGGLSLAEIAAVATRPLVGLEEEPSELERACAAARAEVDALSEDYDGDEGLDPATLESNPSLPHASCGRSASCGGALGATAEGIEEGFDEDASDDGSAGSSADGWLGGLAVAVQTLRGCGNSGPSASAGSPMEFMGGGGRSSDGSGGGGDAATSAHASMAVDTPPAGVRSLLLRSADDLLFDLDEEGNPGKALSPRPASPPPGRPAASAFAGAGLASPGPPSPGAIPHPTQGSSLESSETGFPSPAPTLARSLAAAPAAPWQRALAARRTRLRRRATGLKPAATAATGGLQPSNDPKPRAGRARAGGAAYPPPVEGGAPGAVSGVFAGLDDERWALFMGVLRDLLAATVGSGRWKASAAAGYRRGAACAAVSCPRF